MTQPIFNSLGSNYSPELVAITNKFQSNPTAQQDELSAKLESELGQRFDGNVILIYKGRDAIELVMRPLADPRSTKKIGVLTQGLACHAIEEGILRAGLTPVYVDLEAGTLGPSVKTLEDALHRAKEMSIDVKAVFLQNTLGYANPVAEIKKFCHDHDFFLIEDLAQSFGADEHGKELGTFADAVICSFGRDKVIDAISGGAVIYKKQFWQKLKLNGDEWIRSHQPVEFPPLEVVNKEMMYPGLTQLIRGTHQILIGKVIFQVAKLLGWLTSPISTPVEKPTRLPAGYISVALAQLKELKDQLEHRRKLAKIYVEELQNFAGLECLVDPKELEHDIHLRIPILFTTPHQLQKTIQYCLKQDIYLTDRWYREVVDSGSLHYPTVYQQGSCPEAERVSKLLLNLPTHRFVTEEGAIRIAAAIKESLIN